MRDRAARAEGASICASENILEFLTAGGFTADRLVHIPKHEAGRVAALTLAVYRQVAG